MDRENRLVVRMCELPKVIGIKRTAIATLMSKGDFPKPIQLGGKSRGILVSELEEWLANRKAQRDGG